MNAMWGGVAVAGLAQLVSSSVQSSARNAWRIMGIPSSWKFNLYIHGNHGVIVLLIL